MVVRSDAGPDSSHGFGSGGGDGSPPGFMSAGKVCVNCSGVVLIPLTKRYCQLLSYHMSHRGLHVSSP